MNTRMDMLEGDVFQITFDREGSSANVFDRATITELEGHLDAVENSTTARGVIFASAKKSIFIAGADITELLSDEITRAELRDMVGAGQRLFTRIAGLPIPTVAVIHGASLGGGYELCLACDYRLASDDRATRIGLPETSLGILPAWGGCARLPRLIGLPKALDVILKGRRLAARQARRYGMVDEVIPREHFVRRARVKIAEGKPRRSKHLLVNNALAANVIARRVRPGVEKQTRGQYPAVTRALEVVAAGVSRGISQALALEEQAVADLVPTDVCRNLVRIFFLQERAKRMALEDLSVLGGGAAEKVDNTPPTGPVAVVGAGVMGAGIAQWLSTRSYDVVLRDIDAEQVRKGMATISKVYAEGVKRHVFSRVEARQGLDRIIPAAAEVPLKRVDLVIEAAVENMDIKKTIFARLKELAADDTILATNTSALSINEIGVAAGCPERVIGIHFFNPVHRMQLVEIVVGEQTSPEVVARTLRFVQKIGKLPVVVKDRPGFVVNRILMPYLTEAGHLFEAGARVEDIDEAMLDFGMPMGPLRLIDEVGVDVAHHVAAFFTASFGERMPMPSVLEGMLEKGMVGRKKGQGFYFHEKGKRDARPHDGTAPWVTSQRAAGWSREDLAERMVLVMLNEAARCVEEGVASTPSDIDFAMIMGTGFAPFRGGPLRHADTLGAKKIVAGLSHLAGDEDPRFAPCELLKEMAESGRTFYEGTS